MHKTGIVRLTVADPGIGRGGGGHRRGCGEGWGEVVGGAAPGRVREGGTPPAQLGGVGERCKLPHRGLGLRPRSQRFLPPKKYVKTALKCNYCSRLGIDRSRAQPLYVQCADASPLIAHVLKLNSPFIRLENIEILPFSYGHMTRGR